LNIANSCISEPFLKVLLMSEDLAHNKEIKYRMAVQNGQTVLNMSKVHRDKFKTSYTAQKGNQTDQNTIIKPEEVSNEKKVTSLLNNIVKLKQLKEPLKLMPEAGSTIKGMKEQVDSKIIDNLINLTRLISGEANKSLDEMLQMITTNLQTYKEDFIEGIPKLRIIKLLLIEIAELKREGNTVTNKSEQSLSDIDEGDDELEIDAANLHAISKKNVEVPKLPLNIFSMFK